MAPLVNRCWTLVLGACLALTVRADCEKECELCLFRLQGRQADLSLITCVQECEGGVSTVKSLGLCRDVPAEEGDPGRAVAEQQDQLAKRYGGFMRRYGGFMKKSAEVAVETAGELGKRYGGFMKKDDGGGRLGALKELLAAAAAGEQRHGGVTHSAELGGGVRALQKRYGGFMRRVGSPNWEENKKPYEGLSKRAWGPEEGAGSLGADKRYGGFMD
ncbi:proenkephalin-A-like [Anguilla anguilla]|uniref:proenkephalin-A-like n=1 Tax=Anguilla anguilla TaxID=7936 RepID=UPI0015AA81D7|nr:proenkephalin-A-like [Anguilla anguilla]